MDKRTRETLHSSQATDWETPADFFAQLDAEFHFTLDAAADDLNHKTRLYFNEQTDGLVQSWHEAIDGRLPVVWLNPPYGRHISDWMRKAYDESQKGATVVVLVPARVGTRWWNTWV